MNQVPSFAPPFGKSDVPVPEGLFYTLEQLQQGMRPGYRPLVPKEHLIDGVIKLTYSEAVKYYSPTLAMAHRAKEGVLLADAVNYIKAQALTHSVAIEEVLRYLLDVYPPHVREVGGFPQHRPWELDISQMVVKRHQNDFMGTAPAFYQFLKLERMTYNRAAEDFQRLAVKHPEMLGIQSDIEKLKGRVADLTAFIDARGLKVIASEDVSAIKPYKLRDDPDWELKREYLCDIMTGDPRPFFHYLCNEIVEQHRGLEGLRDRIAMATSPEQEGKLADIWLLAKSRYDDLHNWLRENCPTDM